MNAAAQWAMTFSLVVVASASAAQCEDAPWSWASPEHIANDENIIWFIGHTEAVDRLVLEGGTIPSARRGEQIGHRIEFRVLGSWGEELPRRLTFDLPPDGVDWFDVCRPPYRTESWTPDGLSPNKTWLVAAEHVRNEAGPDTYRLVTYRHYQRWSEALALRRALGPAEFTHEPIDPPPTLEELANALTHPGQVRQDDALWFWLTRRCGLEYLGWRLNDLDLPESETSRLRTMTAHVTGGPPLDQDGPSSLPMPPYDPAMLRSGQIMPFATAQACSDSERQWVAVRVGEFRAAQH